MRSGDADGYAATGFLGEKVPSGWTITAAKFEVEWPADEDRAGLVRSHFGARRKAFNWGLERVKADLDARSADPEHESVGWDLGALPKAWNRAKGEVAPWWAANSKEAYSAGLADLAQALSNWGDSRSGRRAARRAAGRELSRRIAGSNGYRAAKAKLSRLDRRCVYLRREDYLIPNDPFALLDFDPAEFFNGGIWGIPLPHCSDRAFQNL